MRRALIAGLFIALADPVFADYFDDGNQIYTKCTAGAPLSENQCVTVASAYFDMMQSIGYGCRFTQGVTRGQVTDVLKKYLADHPESRNQAAASIAFKAYKTAFGCELKLNP